MNRREFNRRMVAQKLYVEGYEEQEKAVEGWGLGEPKPRSIRIGELPIGDYEGIRSYKMKLAGGSA